MSDSESESKDAEGADAESTDAVAPSPRGEFQGSHAQILRRTEYEGPLWANPEILKGLPPDAMSDHLRGAMEYAGKTRENEFRFATQKLDAETESEKRAQVFLFASLIIVLVVFSGLSWLFLTFKAKELIAPVIAGLGGLGAGFAGGYGFAKRSGEGS